MYELPQVEVRLRLAEAMPLYSEEQISTATKAVEIMALALKELDREEVLVVNFDSKNHPINFHVVSIGGLAFSYVPMQNVFKAALLCNASGIILFHNHPSGDVTPSTEDIDVTAKVYKASRIMEIPLMDHIIVGGGNGNHYSIREHYPELWGK